MLIWVITFSLTCLLELPIYVFTLRRVVRLGWALALVLGLNLATHPIVWFLLPRLFENQLHYVLIAEAFAVVVEGLVLGALAFWRRWEGWGWLSDSPSWRTPGPRRSASYSAIGCSAGSAWSAAEQAEPRGEQGRAA